MTNRLFVQIWSVAAAALIIAALPAWWWGPRMVASVLVGGAWNLGSLWCLAQLLRTWLQPAPRRRTAWGWLALKIAWVGALIAVVLRASWLSFIGFGIGLTIVLMVVIISLGLRANLTAHQPYGR